MGKQPCQNANGVRKPNTRSRLRSVIPVPPAQAAAISHSLQAISENIIRVDQLQLPADFRALLYTKEEKYWIQYTDLEIYCASHPYTIDLTDDDEPETPTDSYIPKVMRPPLVVDLSRQMPAGPIVDSFDVLPYIWASLSFPQLHFHYTTMNATQGPLFHSFLAHVVMPHSQGWEQYVLECGDVKEVIVWWKHRHVDVVLKTGSARALEWECAEDEEEGIEPKEMRTQLGLTNQKKGAWRGAVIVGSVEEETTANCKL